MAYIFVSFAHVKPIMRNFFDLFNIF
jgi:hypothetical protein